MENSYEQVTEDISNTESNMILNLEEHISMQLMEILSDDTVKVKINQEFDIPVYVSKSHRSAKHKKVLVLSGGGSKGICYFGAFKALEELNILDKFEEFSCCSVGTLIIAMYLIGYTVSELWEFILNFDLDKVKNINFLDITTKFGVDDGSKLEYLIKRLISAKGLYEDITMRDLFLKTGKKFVISTVCVNSKSVEYISHETDPNLPVYKAVRMSSSIPFFYVPTVYNGKMYTDGGSMDNFPWLPYKDRMHEVLALYISCEQDYLENIDSFETYAFRILHCINKGLSYVSKKVHTDSTVNICVDSIVVTKFDLSTEQKQKLYDKGYQAIMGKLGVST